MKNEWEVKRDWMSRDGYLGFELKAESSKYQRMNFTLNFVFVFSFFFIIFNYHLPPCHQVVKLVIKVIVQVTLSNPK